MLVREVSKSDEKENTKNINQNGDSSSPMSHELSRNSLFEESEFEVSESELESSLNNDGSCS
jgi:hypothetical protein